MSITTQNGALQLHVFRGVLLLDLNLSKVCERYKSTHFLNRLFSLNDVNCVKRQTPLALCGLIVYIISSLLLYVYTPMIC